VPPQPRPPVCLAARPPFASRWTMTLLADGVGRLDSARGIAWVQLSNGARNAVLKSVEGSEFFTTICMATINNLYTTRWSIASSAATSLLRTCILLALVQRATLHAGAAEFPPLAEKRRATVLLMVGQTARAFCSCTQHRSPAPPGSR
jgi:hypothetical protein